MPLDAPSVTARANSDLICINLVAEDTTLSAPERMELILRAAQTYDAATTGSTERFRAKKILPKHHDSGIRRAKD